MPRRSRRGHQSQHGNVVDHAEGVSNENNSALGDSNHTNMTLQMLGHTPNHQGGA
jgi:hypothetical protein